MNQSRRQILKLLAAAPLILPFGLATSPLMRYLKPTMKPLGYFDPADLPGAAEEVFFHLTDFPEPWTCLPFMFNMKITEFNPELEEIREIPAFIIRTNGDEIVAYSRICPIRHGYRCILNWVAVPNRNCGCAPTEERCCCFVKVNHPVLSCPCTNTAFDPANDGRVIHGSAPRPPRRFDLEREQNMIAIVRLEPGAIT
jgi:Rieske Fe-S protein